MICVGLGKRPEAHVNHNSCESQWDEKERKLLEGRLGVVEYVGVPMVSLSGWRIHLYILVGSVGLSKIDEA